MDYWKIVVDSYRLNVKHRFLWPLGILAMLTEGSVMNWWVSTPANISIPSLPDGSEDYNLPNGSTSQILGSSSSPDAVFDWIATYALFIIIAAGILIVLLIFFFILSEIAKFGLVGSVDRLLNNRTMSFFQGLRIGAKVFWRGFLFELLVGLFFLVYLSVFIVPSIVLLLLQSYAVAAFAMLLAILPIIIGLVYFRLLNLLGLRMLIIEKTRVWEAVRGAHQRIRSQLREVIIGWLVLLLVGIVLSLALSFLLLVVLIVFGLLLLLAWIAGGIIATLIFGGFLLLLFLIMMTIISGILTSWTSTYWTILYLRLPKLHTSA